MKRTRWTIIGGLLLFAAVGGGLVVKTAWQPKSEASSSPAGERVRRPAVAGLFYPRDGQTLGRQVDAFLAGVKDRHIENVRGLICPHAGYRFSGQTAAESYKQLTGRNVRTVVVMAPSHYADFKGASIPDVDAYETPLGKIPLSPKAKQLARIPPFVRNPKCVVRRPQWWRQAPKQLPPFGADTPHTWEHSLEVQLPFLQKTLKGFTLIPIVLRRVDPRAVAKVLLEHALDDQTVFVASTDLSHYHPYDLAKRLDEKCVQAIVSLNIEDMSRHEACGMQPVLTLMHMARLKGWQAKLLKYCNSGDTAGDKSGVVGYAAIVFFDSGQRSVEPQTQPTTRRQTYSSSERSFLLKLARKTLVQVVTTGNFPKTSAPVAAKLTEQKGCFVTLTIDGRLRGCIGHVLPKMPLYKAVMDNTRSAALLDKRFKPVRPKEIEKIEIEISVLTVPRRLEYESTVDLLMKLRPHVDGVLLKVGTRQSIYLPQVWEQIPNKGLFMNSLAQKAQLPPSAWQRREAMVWTYQAEAFSESEMHALGSE